MVRKIVIVFICSLINLIANATNTPNYFFSKVTSDNGLSHNEVKSIMQDSWGFMWFGTRNRLNRYDGRSMKVYDCYDPIANKRNNNVSALFEDADRNIWVGTDKGIFIFDPVFEKFTSFSDSTKEGIQIIDWIADIKCDNDNNIWIVAPNQGLFVYRNSNKKLYLYSFGSPEQLPDRGSPECISIERNGKIWIGTNGEGVYLYNKEQDNFTQFLGDRDGNTLEGKNIFAMADYGEFLVVGIHEGALIKLHKRKNILEKIKSPEVNHKIIRAVECLNDNELWVGTESGLFIINELTNSVEHIQEDLINPYSLSDNIIGKIYQDNEGGVWLGTFFEGLNYLPNLGMKFEKYIPSLNGDGLSSKRIRPLSEDDYGNIWIGSEDGGIDVLNPQTRQFTKLTGKFGINLTNKKILSISTYNNKIWVGLFKDGLDVITMPGFSRKHYSGDDLGLDESSIYAICEDHDGNYWIGNGWGVFKSVEGKMEFRKMEEFGLSFVYDIMEDSKGNIWAATLGKGVFKYTPADSGLIHFTHKIDDPKSLSSNSVSDITETNAGDIWFSTDRGGICKYNEDENNFTTLSTKEGLPDNVTYKILEDKHQNLWFGTNNGLVKYNPETKDIRVFLQGDGLLGNQFNYKSALVSRTGKFYFGGLSGLIAFNPYQYEENEYMPPVYITRLSIFNEEPTIGDKKSPLEKSIVHTSDIILRHNQGNIAFSFASLSYTSPLSNNYAYKLEGVDKEWIYESAKTTVSYANLSPGKYVFRVKGSNNDGLWNEKGATVNIRILPPWWFSFVAYIVYAVLFIAVMLYILINYKKKQEKRSWEKQILYETEKEKELYGAKVDFFTSIAHEIRTPLTLINGPLESIKEKQIDDPEVSKNLNIMENNTKQLLSLINELLDFRKIDSNKFLLKFSDLDVNKLLKSTKEEFDLLAKQQNKSISLTMPEKSIVAIVDKNELKKILNNLLVNAVKYSDKQIKINLSLEGNSFKIVIFNDGVLVEDDQIHKIFDPFYQVERNRNMPSSTGIGLSLARSIAELHNGSLHFETISNMNTFVLELPLKQTMSTSVNYQETEQPEDYIIEETSAESEKNIKPKLLLVEDNREMLSFIADRLKKEYSVDKTTNGIEALKILEEENFDIILSDIMMPEMDGFKLCESIKNDIEYSHIPIVLLTAKNDLDSKIRGLEAGADAYIEKPFAFSYLTTQLTALLNNRQREKEAFMQKPFLPIEQIGMNKADEKFMEKIISIINDNITDSDFNVEKLSEIVFMSRSSLYRKIKALTELTPTDFIRLIRLKKAAELIKDGDYRIGEVCYLVGINSPSYFIKLFQKQFGMTPKEFEMQERS